VIGPYFSKFRNQLKMIRKLKKQDAVYIWNNHYQGTFKPSGFDTLLGTNDIISNELWQKQIDDIKRKINAEVFESFLNKYREYQIEGEIQELESFVKKGKKYLKLDLCLNGKNTGFMACFLLDQDYVVQYLCIDSKIEIATLSYEELNVVYNKYNELIPPPVEFVERFNRMNAEITEITGKDVDRLMYQAWFRLTPKVQLDVTFAKAYHTYQSKGESIFGHRNKNKQVSDVAFNTL
jgi:hypothetical protein